MMSLEDGLAVPFGSLLAPPGEVEEEDEGDSMTAALLASLMGGGGGGRRRRGGGPSGGGQTHELFYGGNEFNPSESVDPTHMGHLHWAAPHRLIRRNLPWLQRKGFTVGEFGDAGPGHVEGSYHYKGRGQAADINYYGGGRWDTEGEALDWLERALARRFGTG